MMGVDDFLIGIVGNLVAAPISGVIDNSGKNICQRKTIEGRVYAAINEVLIPIIPFLEQEKITEQQQRLLIEACERDLKKLAENPAYLFQGSLNGQKIFDNLYSGEGKKLPDVVIDEKLEGVYGLLFPRIATVVCKIPAAVKDWENEAWTENYRRLDDLATELRALFEKVDTLAKRSDNETDSTLQLIRRTLAQKIGLELDLTGLRGDKPVSGRFTDFFVHPEISCILSKLDQSIEIHFSKDIHFVEQNNRKLCQINIKNTDLSFTYFTAKNTKTILEGAPGSGKSTWSKWLQQEVITRENWTGIAIRIELRSLGDSSLPKLPELVKKSNPNLSDEITGDKIRKWLDAQQIIFILDGFDEVAPKNRDAVRDWILDLEIVAGGCPFIVTSRPLTTSHLEDLKALDWSAANVLPFDKERIIDYIKRWYQYCELLTDSDRNIDASELADQWFNDPTIEPLTGNPLMLSTLLMVHHLDGELPSGRSELYKRYVKGMLGLWDDRRKLNATDIQLTPQQKEQILRGIALHFHLEEQDQLDEDQMTELVKKLLQKFNIADDAEKVLQVLRERTGLIIGPGIYSFVHKSVAEYFVAESVFQGDQKYKDGASIDRLALLSHREDDRWKIVIFLWAGLTSVGDLVDFIDSCKERNSWPLAYGLLYDQYDKIPSETRTKINA